LIKTFSYSISLQLLIHLIDKIFIEKLKKVKFSTILLPSLNFFSYGSRYIYLSKPKNKNELFDISISNIFLSIGLSMVFIYLGLYITTTSPIESLSTYPEIPTSLVISNNIIYQIFLSIYPKELTDISIYPTTSIHVHPLAAVGLTTFIGTILRLLPLDNGPSIYLINSLFKGETPYLVKSFANVIAAIYLIISLFTLNHGKVAEGIITIHTSI